MQPAIKTFRLPYYQPHHYRSDEEQLEEIENVEASLIAEISAYGVLNSQESCFGWYFTCATMGWPGDCSPNMPGGLLWGRLG